MRDPYLYDGSSVLKNKLGIRVGTELDNAEADYVVFRLKELVSNPLSGSYNTEHLFEMHRYIFQDLYDWAGKPRNVQIYKSEPVLGDQSVEYSEPENIVKDTETALCQMRNVKWLDLNTVARNVEFCACLARLWKVHPFREGNTRTIVTFCCQFTDDFGFTIDRTLLEENSGYLRTALVAYNAYFADGNDFSKKEYLERIIGDALSRGSGIKD